MFRVNKALIGDNQGGEGAKYHVKFYCFLNLILMRQKVKIQLCKINIRLLKKLISKSRAVLKSE